MRKRTNSDIQMSCGLLGRPFSRLRFEGAGRRSDRNQYLFGWVGELLKNTCETTERTVQKENLRYLDFEKGSSLQVQIRAYVLFLVRFAWGALSYLLLSKAYTNCAICFEHFDCRQDTGLELHGTTAIGFLSVPSNIEVATVPTIGNLRLIVHEYYSQPHRNSKILIGSICSYLIQATA